MKNFAIDQVLIFNPKLKSQKKKPIQSDIQQAKVMAFFPVQAQIQQKCNTVGMAEGVFEFCNSLLPQQLRQQTLQTVFMDTCCLVLKQVQQNIWIFIKLNFIPDQDYTRIGNEQEQTYISNSFTQELLENFINHFYFSFKIFYGKISGYLFLQKLSQLQKIMNYFVPKYIQINSYLDKKGLDVMSYMIKNIRAISLDINSTLKYTYFKNVMQNYDSSVKDLIVFANGMLTFTSLDKHTTQFFAQYLFNTTEPFRFQNQKIQHKFRILPQIPLFSSVEKYGTIFNSIVFGFQDDLNNTSIRNSRSSLQISGISGIHNKIIQNQDLLGMDQQQQIELLDVFIQKNGQEIKYKLNYFIQKSMIYLTFYKQVSAINQLIFSNRFFHDNSHKFLQKISQVLTTVLNQTDVYRFLFVNQSTYIGKCTFKDWTTLGKQIKHALITINKNIQGTVATKFNNHWVYGVKRFNRILILLIPNETPLHKLQDFAQKMTKQYFFKCFM